MNLSDSRFFTVFLFVDVNQFRDIFEIIEKTMVGMFCL